MTFLYLISAAIYAVSFIVAVIELSRSFNIDSGEKNAVVTFGLIFLVMFLGIIPFLNTVIAVIILINQKK